MALLECARCFLPNSHILVVTERIMPGLFPHLADLWQVVCTTRSLGSPASLETHPGMLLFTGEAPQPFWPEAIVGVGSADDNTPWVVDLPMTRHRHCEGRQRLLAKPKAVDPDTPSLQKEMVSSHCAGLLVLEEPCSAPFCAKKKV